jgi:endonuclease-3
VGRKCGECTLSGRGLCPSAVVQKKAVVKRVKKEVVKDEGVEGIEVGKIEEVVVKEEEKLAEDVR